MAGRVSKSVFKRHLPVTGVWWLPSLPPSRAQLGGGATARPQGTRGLRVLSVPAPGQVPACGTTGPHAVAPRDGRVPSGLAGCGSASRGWGEGASAVLSGRDTKS